MMLRYFCMVLLYTDDKVFLHGIAVYFYTSNMFFIYR